MDRNIFSRSAPTPKFKPTKWVFMAGLIGIILLSAWIYLPYAIADLIKRELVNSGHINVKLEDINFDPLSGRILATNVQFATKDYYALELGFISVKFLWRPLLDKKVVIKNILLKDASIHIYNADKLPYKHINDLEIAKTITELFPKQYSPQFNLDIIELYKTSLEITYLDKPSNLYMDLLTIQDLSCCTSISSAQIDLQAKFEQTPFQISGNITPFGERPSFEGKIITNNVSLSNYSAVFKQWFKSVDGNVSIDSSISVKIDKEKVRLAQSGVIKLDKIYAENSNIHMVEDSLLWQGDSESLFSRNLDLEYLKLKGQITANDFYINLPNQELSFEFQTLQWQGSTSINSNSDGFQDVHIDGDSTSRNLDIKDTSNNFNILTASEIVYKNIDITNLDSIEANSVIFSDFSLAKKASEKNATNSSGNNNNNALWHSAKLQINKPQILNLTQVTTDSIIATDNSLYIHKLDDEKWHIFDELQNFYVKLNQYFINDPNASTIIKMVKFIGNNNLYFRDDSVSPNYKVDIDLAETEIGKLISSKTTQKIKIKLNGHLNEQGKMSVAGTIQPFAQTKNSILNIKVSDFDLSSINPYMQKYAGYNMASGRLDGKMSFNFAGDLLSSHTNIVLSNLSAKRLNGNIDSVFQRNLAISLNEAVAILNNKDRRFRARIKINTKSNNANLNYIDAYAAALGKQLLDGSIQRIKRKFRPYNKSISIRASTKQQPAKITLNPVIFSPGNTLLNTKAIEYLDTVMKVLNKNRKMTVSLCGTSTKSDRQIFDLVINGKGRNLGQKKEHIKLAKLFLKSHARNSKNTDKLLYRLAKQRSLVVSKYLLSQRDIHKERILRCKISVDNSKRAVPRVDLLL